jgi:small nuclear ribonucleoprotein B and B'
MMQLVGQRLRLTLQDGRVMAGQLLAYDKHMNLVLADTEEFRKPHSSKTPEQRRTLGLVMLRGEQIVSMCPEGAPTAGLNKTRVPAASMMAPGVGRPVGRGMPVPAPGLPVGLAGPVPGMYTPPGGFVPGGAGGMPMPPQ